MTANGLNAYSVSIRPSRSTEPKLLGSFHEKNSLADAVHDILKIAQNYHYTPPPFGKCVTFDSVSRSGDSISGLALAGDYGTSNKLIDINNGNTTYRKKQTDASMVPFFFQWYLPPRHRQGILLSQRIGQSGVRGVMHSIVAGELQQRFPEYRLDVQPLMPEAAIKALLKKSTVHEVRFVQNIIPPDIADRFNGTKTAQEGELELVLRPKRKGYLNPGALLDLLSGKKNVGELIQVQSFEPDNIKAEISTDGRRRIINFGQLGRLRATFDISNDIDVGPDGYASMKSLKTAGQSLVEELAIQMKITS